MVKINNKEFKTYDLDSETTIFSRIASEMKTLPKFLIFTDGIPDIEVFAVDENIEVLNLLEIIINTTNIYDLYNEVKKYKDKILEYFDLQNCVRYYMLVNKNFNREYQNAIEYGDIVKISTINDMVNSINIIIKENDIKNYYNIRNNIEELWVRIKTNKKQLDIDIEENFNKWNLEYPKKNDIKIFKIFEEEEVGTFTEFELEKVKFEFELELENVSSILEIFNNIILNTNIPFASTNNFYKIFKGFIPPVEWSNLFDKSTSFRDKYKDINRETNIILKVLEEKKVKNIDSYTEIILSIKKINVIQVKVEYNKENISKNEIINSFLSVFNTKNKIQNEKESNVNGVYYIPMQKLNKEGLLDMIMNNNLFSNLLVVNESKIGKKNSVHIYFENSKIGKITANITPYRIEKNDILRFKFKDFPLKSFYIRVKITKCDNIKKVTNFQKLFSKLFIIYNKGIDDVLKFYEDHYCPIYEDIEDEFVEDVNKKIKLKDIDPFVFQPNYGKLCDTEPVFLTDEQAQLKILEGKEDNIIRFPKEKTENSFPKYYMCDDETLKFPGLRDNPYLNNDVLPYIPCCYEKNQKIIEGSKYRNYYFDEPLNEREYKVQDIKKTNKILEYESHGYLPENLNKLFFIGDQEGIYYREGVFRNKSSFLNCVMQALNKETNILKYKNKDSRLNYLNKIRKELATPKYASYCKQEMYEYNIDDIVKKIENPEEYFDPKLFIHLLELYFNCNIFLFSRENDGELLIPRNIQCYYKMKNKKKCIFVFEHLGSTADKATYPQCELIIRQISEYKKDTENIFSFSSPISKNIFNVFEKYSASYILNKKISLININWPWNNAISQIIDSYGKTRGINITYNSNTVSIITDPIQPVNLIEDVSNIIYNTDVNTAYEILNELNADNIETEIYNNNKKIKGIIGNINVYILVDDSSKFSSILEYNKYKKLSRYITEYMFWIFSKYLKENNLKEVSETVYKDFKNKYILVNKDFEYKDIGKLFSMKNSGIINDNKLIVKSEETLKRLFYVLRMKLLRNEQELLDYYQKDMIDNYYLNITDFKYNNTQLVLQGEKAFYRLISEDTKNVIHKEVYLKQDKINIKNEVEEEDEDDIEEEIDRKKKKVYDQTPYFLKNKLIDNKIYLAQNVDTYLKGIKISEIWKDNKYNPGVIEVENDSVKEFMLYSFKNMNSIKLYKVEGEKNDLDIKILGYKIKDPNTYKIIPLYTVLLSL